MNQRKISLLKNLRTLLICLGVGVAVFVSLVLIRNWEKQQGSLPWQDFDSDTRQTIRYDGEWYTLRDNVETVLVLGLDKFEVEAESQSYNNDNCADFLSLLVLDKDKKSVTALHLNRDTMAKINILGLDGSVVGSKTAQLSLAHTYGSGGKDSCKNTVASVSNFLYQTPIDHYVSLKMDAVKILNDMVGGVTLTVLDDFSSIDKSLVKGREITLSGDQALTYVRERGGLEDSSNEARMNRQKQYMNELFKKVALKSSGEEDFISKAGVKLSQYMFSDCTINQLERISNFVSQNKMEIQSIKGTSSLGEQFMEFRADEKALKKQIINLFYEPKK